MTATPYIVTPASATIELNSSGATTDTEDIDKTQPIIAAGAAGGDTRNNLLAALMSGTRTVYLTGTMKSSSQSNLNTWFQSIDSLVVGATFSAITYYANTITAVYSSQAYIKGYITDFKVSKTEEQGGDFVLNWTLEITEGSGING